MPIVFNSKLSSAKANEAFMDRQVDTDTIGKVGLNNADIESGSQITNAQREINKAKKLVNTSSPYLDGSQITLDTISTMQIFRLIGNGAPVTLNALVFSNQPLDGAEILLIGQDDINTVKISVNDTQYGQFLNGDAVLFKGASLRLIYDEGLERFVEIGRNF